MRTKVAVAWYVMIICSIIVPTLTAYSIFRLLLSYVIKM